MRLKLFSGMSSLPLLKAATTRAPGIWLGLLGSFSSLVKATTWDVSSPMMPSRSSAAKALAKAVTASGSDRRKRNREWRMGTEKSSDQWQHPAVGRNLKHRRAKRGNRRRATDLEQGVGMRRDSGRTGRTSNLNSRTSAQISILFNR